MNIQFDHNHKEQFKNVKEGSLFRAVDGCIYIKGFDLEYNSIAIDIRNGEMADNIGSDDIVFVLHHKVSIFDD